MNKTKNWFTNKFVPFVSKLGNQRHLAAIRDAFAIFTPVLIAGSLAIVLRSAIFAGGGGTGSLSGLFVSFSEWKPSGDYRKFLNVMDNTFVFLQWGTINLMTIYFVFGLGYFITKSRGVDTPVIAGLVVLAAFLAGTDTVEGGIEFLGAKGLIGGLVSGLIFAELFSWLAKSEKLKLTMPSGVPPAVGRAFSRLFPALLTLATAAAVTGLIGMGFYLSETTMKVNGSVYDGFWGISWGKTHTLTLTSLIYATVVQPFLTFASNDSAGLGIALLYVLLISFFWFFGLHGTNIVNAGFNPLFLMLLANNQSGAHNVFAQGTFDAYVFIGGWGATLSLIIATLIFGKKGGPEREISKYALPAGVFQINEPVTFGYPLVLNATLAIPLFLVQPILVLTTWFFIGPLGLVPKSIALIPWTMPVGFGGLLSSASPWGFVLAIMNMAIAVLIYTPFVMLNKGSEAKAEKAANTSEGKKAAAKGKGATKVAAK